MISLKWKKDKEHEGINCLAAMGHKSGFCVRCEEPLVALIYSDLSCLFNQ